MSRIRLVYAGLFCLLVISTSAVAAEPAAAQGSLPATPSPPVDTPPTAENVTPELAARAVAVTPLVLLLRDDRVRAELKLNAEQAAAIDQALTDVQGQLWYVRDRKDAATDAGRGRVYDHLRNAVVTACEPTQVARLDGLLLHLVGWRAVRLEQFASQLDLSTGQLTRISKLIEPSPDATAKTPLTPKQLKALEAVLTAPQQRIVSQILGKEFDLSQLPSRHCPAPELADIAEWINSEPLELSQLHGKVVVVHFWTFGCINCIRNIPHYEAWYQKYLGRDVVIVGVHTPETEGERDLSNVRAKVAEYKMQYPIAVDGSGATWNAWANAWWPSVYLIDKRGYVRDWWYGEMNWQDAKGEEYMRGRIDALLAE